RREFASGRCDSQLLCPELALQTGRGAGAEYSHALQAHGDWRDRDCLRGTLRAGTLKNARHRARCQPGGLRQVAGGSGGGETITWSQWRTRTRTLLRVSFGNTFSASITKSLGFSISSWH